MKYLKYLFEERITLEISNGNKKHKVECELASSEIEIFQSLTYRKAKEFTTPLVLLFDNPIKQYFSNQKFSFPVLQINVYHKSQLVKKVGVVQKSKTSRGAYIQSYSEFSMVILAPINAEFGDTIIENKTKIKPILKA